MNIKYYSKYLLQQILCYNFKFEPFYLYLYLYSMFYIISF